MEVERLVGMTIVERVAWWYPSVGGDGEGGDGSGGRTAVRGWCYDEGGVMVGCGGEAARGSGGAWRRVDTGIG
ncbi:hypothetical protein Tco_0385345 [Tanacetum coccineum]